MRKVLGGVEETGGECDGKVSYAHSRNTNNANLADIWSLRRSSSGDALDAACSEIFRLFQS